MSSPFFCVFGDDNMTCHMGVDDVPGNTGEAYGKGLVWESFLRKFTIILFSDFCKSYFY